MQDSLWINYFFHQHSWPQVIVLTYDRKQATDKEHNKVAMKWPDHQIFNFLVRSDKRCCHRRSEVTCRGSDLFGKTTVKGLCIWHWLTFTINRLKVDELVREGTNEMTEHSTLTDTTKLYSLFSDKSYIRPPSWHQENKEIRKHELKGGAQCISC